MTDGLRWNPTRVAEHLPISQNEHVSPSALHRERPCLYADTPQRFLDEHFDIGSTDPNDHGHISLDKAKAGNLGAEFFSIWVEPETNQGHFARHTLDLIDSVYEQAARHPDRMMMAFSVADIERAHREHKLAALLGMARWDSPPLRLSAAAPFNCGVEATFAAGRPVGQSDMDERVDQQASFRSPARPTTAQPRGCDHFGGPCNSP